MLHRFTNWFGRGGLLRRMIALFLLLVLLPSLALGAILYVNSVQKQIENTVAYEQRMVEMMGAQVQMLAAQVERLVDTLANDGRVLRLLSSTYILSRADMILDLQSVASETLGGMASHLKDLDAFITLYSTRENIPEKYYTILYESRLRGDDFDAFLAGGPNSAWGSLRSLMPPGIASPYEPNALVLPYFRKVINITGAHLGTLMVGVAPQRLFSPFVVEEGTLWVVQDGSVLYRNGEPVALPEEMPDHEDILSEDMYLTHTLPALGVQVIRRVPYRPVITAALRSNVLQLCVVTAIGTLYAVLGWLLMRQVLGRLKQTVQAITQSGNASHHVQLPVEGNDEIAQLVEAFNALLRRIEGQVGELLSQEKAKRQAQILALQYQVNPHFLFNSLHFIQMSMEERGDQAMGEAVALLGGILRYNLSDHPYATLEQELEHLRIYVSFMAIWKEAEISLCIACPDGLLSKRILRFALQPIIENALQHGLMPGQPLCICVQVEEKDGVFDIEIENNGAAMSAETLESVRSVLESGQGEEDMLHGVGLRNLSRRLSLIYGEGTTLSVSSVPGKTVFALHLTPRKEGLPA